MLNRRFKPYQTTEIYFIRLVGTRGVLLILLGVIWLILGSIYLTNPKEQFSRPGPGGILDFLDEGLGIYIFASLWVVGGLTAIITAAQRPKTCEDGVGFIGLSLPPMLWASGYWWSWFVNLISHGGYGRNDTYTLALLFTTLTLMTTFLSRHLHDHPEGPCARRRASVNG